MQSYLCYVHTPDSMTPQLRIVGAETRECLIEAMTGLLSEWPDFELLDVYDQKDRLVLRMSQGGDPHIS